MNKLTAKQELFVKHYLIEKNASKAAKLAGYGSPMSVCTRLLENAGISAAIKEKQAEMHQKLDINAERVLQELASVGFANISDYMDWNDGSVNLKDSGQLTREQTGAVSEVVYHFGENSGQVKIKMHDKLKALEKLGSHLGMWKENTTINIQMPDYDEILKRNNYQPRKEPEE